MRQRLLVRKKEIKSKCPKCKGIGCSHCDSLFRFELEMAKANIPRKFWHWNIEDFTNEPIKEKIVFYCNNLKKALDKGTGYLLQGSYGLGKTWMACEILKAAIKQKYTARFTTLADTITLLTKGWYDDQKSEEFCQNVLEVDFLVLDDIGKEYKSEKKNIVDPVFDSLFRARANDCLPTIITSNKVHSVQTEDDIRDTMEQTYGGSLLSLFHEHLIKVIFTGKDYREQTIAPKLSKEFFGDES